jgi:hypothetical protein
MTDPCARITITRVGDGVRTPGADCQLVTGFPLAERLVRILDDLATIEHCTDGTGQDDNLYGDCAGSSHQTG